MLYWTVGQKAQFSLENIVLMYKIILKAIWNDGIQQQIGGEDNIDPEMRMSSRRKGTEWLWKYIYIYKRLVYGKDTRSLGKYFISPYI